MTLPDNLRRNELGYYEISPKPTPAELTEYYARRYYQQSSVSYQPTYRPEELEQIDGRLRLNEWVVNELRRGAAATPPPPGSFLDIGCGEGWALSYFHRRGWDVTGLDFSSFGLDNFHPELRDKLRTGDLYEQLQALAAAGQQYEVLWLDNVLEHVLDPAALLRLCRQLVQPGGVLLVDVPNDFSPVQQHALAQGYIGQPFWVVLPDHLSYFSQASLGNLAVATGWHPARFLADHPIELNLLNPATNYVRDRETGPTAHRIRLELDNLLLRTAPLPAAVSYYEGLANVGLGRCISAFLQPA